MGESDFQLQIRGFLELLGSAGGIVGIVGVLMLVFIALVSPKFKWVVLCFLMWAASLSFRIPVAARRIPVQFAFPLDQIKAYARPLCVALLLVLSVPALLSWRGWRQRVLSGPVLSLFIFQMLVAFRIAAGGVTDRGVLSLFLYVLIFFVMGWGLNKWLQEWKNARVLVRCIVGMGLIFLLTTCYQLVMGPHEIVHNNRLFGTTANPQQAGMLIGIMLPPACYLLMRRGESRLWKLFVGASIAVSLLFLLWTQSRTGMVIGAVGLLFLFRARVGKMLSIGLIVGIFVLIALQIFSESTEHLSSILTRGDTRTKAWFMWWDQFRHNMAWGVMSEEFGIGESSYLSAAANMGLFVLVPMFIWMGITGWNLIKLQRLRRALGENILMADLVTAGLLALAAGAMFEGYLLGTMTIQVFSIYAYLALMAFIQDRVAVPEMAPAQTQWESGDALDYEPAHTIPPYGQPAPVEI
jgi:hypothetical protein